MTYADFEPLISDHRLDIVTRRLRGQFPQLPKDWTFVTYIQPATVIEHNGEPLAVPDVANLSVIFPNPRDPENSLKVDGYVTLDVWREKDRAYAHLVGIPDPAYTAYVPIVRTALDYHANLKAMN